MVGTMMSPFSSVGMAVVEPVDPEMPLSTHPVGRYAEMPAQPKGRAQGVCCRDGALGMQDYRHRLLMLMWILVATLWCGPWACARSHGVALWGSISSMGPMVQDFRVTTRSCGGRIHEVYFR